MADDLDGSDLMVLRRKFAQKPAASTLEGRKIAERRAAMKPSDGRRRSGVVRDTQLNFKVPASFKDDFVATAHRLNLSMVDLLEHGLTLAIKDANRKRQP